MRWYYNLLVRRPYLVVASIGVFSVTCIVVALISKDLPDFDDPTLGFEARGTSIGLRWTAWRNLLEETSSPSGRLTANPKEPHSERDLTPALRFGGKFGSIRKQKKDKKSWPKGKDRWQLLRELMLNKSSTDDADYDGKVIKSEEYDKDKDKYHNWKLGTKLLYAEESGNKSASKKKHSKWETLRKLKTSPDDVELHIPVDGFFCESPSDKEVAHFVVQRVNNNRNDTLLELNALLALCDLEQRIVRTERYEDLCQTKLTSDDCCRPRSVVNYVTLLSNKTSCLELDDEDIATVKMLLVNCFPFYHSKQLINDCARSGCVAPAECKKHDAVYNILHYFADVGFIKLNESAAFLNATMIFLPIARSIKALTFYHNLRPENLRNDLVAVVAIDMGLKNALFDEYLLRDGWLVGLGGIFVVLSMWFYTKSLFATLMTVVAVAFSLGIAFFIYAVILGLTFFPFMNLLAVIVVVGLGADDAYIFLKIWHADQRTIQTPPASPGRRAETLINKMASTFKHAALSMLVTSLTTATAFYSFNVSSITAIRCFGTFAGTAVMANYLLMMTWLPAAVSIAERMPCFELCLPDEEVLARLVAPFRAISQLGRKVEVRIISLVINVPFMWIVLLGITGILSGVMVLYWPKLRLPDSPDFKLFISSHPFERYDSEYRNMFWFERIYGTSDTTKLPLRFVWGVQPVDRGDFLDPERRGPLYFDASFNVSAPESQQWLLEFCRSLERQPFYQMSYGPPNCFIENFISWMGERPCNDSMRPCCEESTFPYAPHVFDACLPESIASLYETPSVAGPKFARRQMEPAGLMGDDVVKAVVVEYESNQLLTMSYGEIDGFVKTVEEWFGRMLAHAPAGMRNGWFTSELEFFDLQDTLSTGPMVAFGVAMPVALFVSLLVTRNVLISLYAIVTVTFSILTTGAVFVLMDWRLNVLESVAVPTAIGLAVAFSLPYGVHYGLATTDSDRILSTQFSLRWMIGPTAMAALTMGIAGALMLPSTVLVYIQIGVFLVIVMSISWIYATFFLMSLLRAFGPQHGFGQFQYPWLRRRNRANSQINSTEGYHNPVSEQLLSNTSSLTGIGSESHELEPLPASPIVQPPRVDISPPIDLELVTKMKDSLPGPSRPSPSTDSANTMFPSDEGDSKAC